MGYWVEIMEDDIRKHINTVALFAVSCFGAGGMALAGELPQGGLVQHGVAQIAYDGDTLRVDQSTDKAIIDWKSFSVAEGNTVHFHQPASDSATLNRVTGGFTSKIAGRIRSNGSVFLVNPNGIMITEHGVVDTGNFVASTLDIDSNDFLNGDYTFTQNGNNGVVANRGRIAVDDGGFVALLGGAVKSSGSVRAVVGKVGFAGGEKIVMSFGDSDFLRVEVPTSTWDTLTDADGNKVSATIDLGGKVESQGGFIDIAVADASDILRQTISIDGIVSANTVSSQNGVISISGGTVGITGNGRITADAAYADAGRIQVAAHTLDSSGKITATSENGNGGTLRVHLKQGANFNHGATFTTMGKQSGGNITFIAGTDKPASISGSVAFIANSTHGNGGYIDITSKDGHIGLLSGNISATGKTQGGRIRLGGAFQGGGFQNDSSPLSQWTRDLFVNRWADNSRLHASQTTKLGNGVHIDVSSTDGTGGTAIIWSDDTTDQLGRITASGKTKGGAVEISGKKHLNTYGLHKVTIGNGELLLDPKNIVIKDDSGLNLITRIFSNKMADSLDDKVERYKFGRSVAMSDDGKRIAIGTISNLMSEKGGYLSGGAVYLFSMDYTTGKATQVKRLANGSIVKDKDGKDVSLVINNRDDFGISVSMDNSGGYLAVGASYTSNGSGKVYAFQLNWTSGDTTVGFKNGYFEIDNTLQGATVASNSSFGDSVAFDGAGTGLAVGARTDNDKGAVYLFTLDWANTTKITQNVKTNNSGLQDDAFFGISVALSDDGKRLAVGSMEGNQLGAVYLFTVADDKKSVTQRLKISGENDNDRFGWAVALNSDATKVFVGAPGYGLGGALYIENLTWQPNGSANKASREKYKHGDTFGGNELELYYSSGGVFGYSLAVSNNTNIIMVGRSDIHMASDGDGRGSVLVFKEHNLKKRYTDLLNKGTNVILHASNDITIDTALDTSSGGNGALKLFAGRSIFINQDVKVKGGLQLHANIEKNEYDKQPSIDVGGRDPGKTKAVITVKDKKTISAGSGDLIITMGDGSSDANTDAFRYSGDITLWKADGAKVSIIHKGKTFASDADKAKGNRIVILSNGQVQATETDAAKNNGDITLELKADGITNNSTVANTLKVASGRFLVWTKYAKNNKLGTIAYDFSQFNNKYDATKAAFAEQNFTSETDVRKTGNGFIYGHTAKYDLAVDGKMEKVYNGNNIADMTGRKVYLSGTNNTDKTQDSVYGLYFTLDGVKGGATDKHLDIKLGVDDSAMQGKYANGSGVEQSDVGKASRIMFTGIKTTITDANNKPVFGAENTNPNNVVAMVAKITPKPIPFIADHFEAKPSANDSNIAVLVLKQGKWGYDKSALVTPQHNDLRAIVEYGGAKYGDKQVGEDKKVFVKDKTKFVLNDVPHAGNYKLDIKYENGDELSGVTGKLTLYVAPSADNNGVGGANVVLAGAAVVGGGAIVAVGAAGAAGAAGAGAAGGAGAGGGLIAAPIGSIENIFNTGIYAYLNGIDMRAIAHPLSVQTAKPKYVSVFNTGIKSTVTYNTKTTATYDLAFLAHNIKAQKAVPVYEIDEKLYQTIKHIFVQQTPPKPHKTAVYHRSKDNTDNPPT